MRWHSPQKSIISCQVKTRTQGAVARPQTRNAEAHLSYPDTSRERAPETGEIGGTRASDHHSFVGALLLEEPSVVEVLGELLPRQSVRHLVGLALVRDPFVVDAALTERLLLEGL